MGYRAPVVMVHLSSNSGIGIHPIIFSHSSCVISYFPSQ